MSWIEKDQSFSFEHQPIEGLFIVDGDAVAREVGLDWTKGQKYPRVAFPSGLKFDLWEGRDSPIVHLDGELDLALMSTRNEAFRHANNIAEQVGYLAAPIGKDKLELITHEAYLFATYDNVQRMMVNVERARFSLGQVVATPGALDELKRSGQAPSEILSRHQTGDWGKIPDEDRKENELSVKKGFRILSAYELPTGEKVWVITEADRSATTILLPADY
jgi:hypothetical protein